MLGWVSNILRRVKPEAYCHSCKGVRSVIYPQYVTIDGKHSQSTQIRGRCVTCGGRINSFTPSV